ncbi:probable transcriptional regulatory protein SPO1072 isoform X1 [Chelonia mydas]|uniref:probable transcriptional regulatory protein SPO1072 isoform X1 n=1 Tax=Chelonia mydas TaxID=8469 RepID=UPI001CA89A74|nr:probable transcriptional regulatory protein SPO1072 isoform X1 [Chelonia mydas]
MPCSGLGAGTEAAAPAPVHWAGPCTPQVPPPAGHNKWSKEKHIKGLRDAERSRLFQKLAMLLRFARKAGGPNPDFNTNLANLTEQCRSMVLTKASTEVAIKGRAGCWSASDPGPTAPRPGDGPKGGTLDRAVAGLGANGRGTARNPGCDRLCPSLSHRYIPQPAQLREQWEQVISSCQTKQHGSH